MINVTLYCHHSTYWHHSTDHSVAESCSWPRLDLARLALLTADALEAVVDAALTGDRTAVRQILHRSVARTMAKAELNLRDDLQRRPPRTGSLRRTACTFQLIADLATIGELVNSFARYLVTNDLPVSVREALGDDIAIIGKTGANRLKRLAAGLPAPAMDPAYVMAGHELRGTLERLAHGSRDRVPEPIEDTMTPLAICTALAEAVLAASRHAAFAA